MGFLMKRLHWWASDRGTVSAFVTTLVLALILLTGLVLDGGLALAAKIRADGQAEAAARAGAQALDLSAYRTDGTIRLIPDQAISNARAHLAAQGATGAITVTDDTVTVTVTATQPTQLLGLIGIANLSVHGQGSARPQQE
jgi:Flp pilus assembly protein TadG